MLSHKSSIKVEINGYIYSDVATVLTLQNPDHLKTDLKKTGFRRVCFWIPTEV